MNVNKHFVELDEDKNYSRFSETRELEKTYKWVDYGAGAIECKGGLSIETRLDQEGNVIGALVDGNDTNTIIISSTGAGKTTRILSPYIANCIIARENLIIHDPKGELYKFFYTMLLEHGYEILVINLRDPSTGDRYNLLQRAARLYKFGNKGRALEIVKDIGHTIFSAIEDKNDLYWTDSAVSLFMCYFMVACDLYEPQYVTVHTIYRIHIEGLPRMERSNAILTYLDEYKNSKAYEQGIQSLTAPSDTKGGIFSVFSKGMLNLLTNDQIVDVLTDSTIDIEKMAFNDKPTALFIITRDEAPDTYSCLVSNIIYDIYSTLIDLAESTDDIALPRTVHFILEEFGNLAKLKCVDNMFSAARSRNIRMVAVIQSLHQMYSKYEESEVKTLIGNSANLVYLHSTDMDMVKYISDKCGTVYDTFLNKEVPLLSPNRLAHLEKEKGETLLLCERAYPYITYFPYISHYKMIKPLKHIEIPKRKPIRVKHGRLISKAKEIVESKKKGTPNFPTFEEFMASRRLREDIADKKDSLIKDIDKMVAELEKTDQE